MEMEASAAPVTESIAVLLCLPLKHKEEERAPPQEARFALEGSLTATTSRKSKSLENMLTLIATGSSSGKRLDGSKICSSIQRFPRTVALDRYVKKGDTPAFAAAGGNHSVLLTKEGKLFRWGVEDGDIYPFPAAVCTQIPLPCVEVCCGRKHTMALMKGGFVMTWGTGYFGQLGHGDNASYRHPRLLRRLDPQRLGEMVIQVACGGYHSAVVTDAGRVFSWGFNRYGQCGNGSKDNTVPEPAPVDLSGVPPGRVGEAPKVVCGRHHSALLASWGALYSWGACGFGKLGLQDPDKTVCVPQEVTYFSDKPLLQAAAGDFHMLALSRSREVFTWGYGAEGQGGNGTLLHTRTPRRVNSLQDIPVTQIVCGPWWSMAVTVDGYCYAWGCSDGGWTGLERPPGLSVVEPGPSNERAEETQSFDSIHNVHVPALVCSLAPYRVLNVGCGGGHSLVVAVRRTLSSCPVAAHLSEHGFEGLYSSFGGSSGGGSGGGGGGPRATVNASFAKARGGDGGNSSGGKSSGTTTSLTSSTAPVSSATTSSASSPHSPPSDRKMLAPPAPPRRQQATGTVAATSMIGTPGVTAAPDLTASTSESGWESGMVDEVAAAAADAAAAAAAAAAAVAASRAAASARSGRRGCAALAGSKASKGGDDVVGLMIRKKTPPQLQQLPKVLPRLELHSKEAFCSPRLFVTRGGSAAVGRNSRSAGGSSSKNRRVACGSPRDDDRRSKLSVNGDAQQQAKATGEWKPCDGLFPAGLVAGGLVDAHGSRYRRDGGVSGSRQRWRHVGTGEKSAAVVGAGRECARSSGSSRGAHSNGNKDGNGNGSGGGGDGRDRSIGGPEYVAKVFSYCRHGRFDQLGRELGAGFDVCGQRDEDGNTLLHCAAQNGLRGMCKAVLREGGSRPLNLKNNQGNTALHYAYAFGFHQLGKYLTMNGADDALLNDQGLTCYEGLNRQDWEPL